MEIAGVAMKALQGIIGSKGGQGGGGGMNPAQMLGGMIGSLI